MQEKEECKIEGYYADYRNSVKRNAPIQSNPITPISNQKDDMETSQQILGSREHLAENHTPFLISETTQISSKNKERHFHFLRCFFLMLLALLGVCILSCYIRSEDIQRKLQQYIPEDPFLQFSSLIQ